MRIRLALGVAGLLSVACGSEMGPIASEAPAGLHMLSVGVTGPGRVLSLPPAIDCPGTCTATFAQGTSVTLAAAPLGDGEFMSWSGDCVGAMGCFVAMEGEAQVIATFGMGAPMPMLER
jgi:hypothetical protein